MSNQERPAVLAIEQIWEGGETGWASGMPPRHQLPSPHPKQVHQPTTAAKRRHYQSEAFARRRGGLTLQDIAAGKIGPRHDRTK